MNPARLSVNLYRILLFINRRIINHEKYIVFANMIPFQANTILTTHIIDSMQRSSELFLLSRILILQPLKLLLNTTAKALISVQSYALESLLQVLIFHDIDVRLNHHVLIARIYIDLLPITLENIQHYSKMFRKNGLKSDATITAAATVKSSSSSSINDGNTSKRGDQKVEYENYLTLLICFIWTLKNLDSPLLKKYYQQLSPFEFEKLILICSACLDEFEYIYESQQQDKKLVDSKTAQNLSKMAETILGEGSAASKLRNRRFDTMAGMNRVSEPNSMPEMRSNSSSTSALGAAKRSSKILQQRMQLLNQARKTNLTIVENQSDMSSIKLLHPAITAEISRVILKSVVNNILFERDIYQNEKVLLNILIKILSLRQCNEIYHITLKFIREFPDPDLNTRAFEVLFKLGINPNIAEIVKSDVARTILNCLENGSERVGVHLLITMSEMIGRDEIDSYRLRTVLKTIFEYIDCDMKYEMLTRLTDPTILQSTVQQTDPAKGSNSSSNSRNLEIIQLIKELDDIIVSHLKLKNSNDPDLKITLLHKIAQSCNRLPVLRIKWLIRTSDKHKEYGQFLEAAVCLIHIAGIILECLDINCDELLDLSPNILEESLLEEQRISVKVSKDCEPEWLRVRRISVLYKINGFIWFFDKKI